VDKNILENNSCAASAPFVPFCGEFYPKSRLPYRPLVKNFTCTYESCQIAHSGAVEVSEKTFRAFCSPMIGHRGQGFKDLYAKIQPQLQSLLYTKQLVYLSTSSAWGVMEGAIRNLVTKKVLCLHVRRLFGQMAGRGPTLRQAGRGFEGGLGFAGPRGAVERKLATGNSTR